MQEFIIRQGDQCNLPFKIIINNSIITDAFINGPDPNNLGDVEITIGELRKTFRNNEIKYNKHTFTFDFPISQEETFELLGNRLRSQIRVKFRAFDGISNNFIYSYDGPDIIVKESLSKESI